MDASGSSNLHVASQEPVPLQEDPCHRLHPDLWVIKLMNLPQFSLL